MQNNNERVDDTSIANVDKPENGEKSLVLSDEHNKDDDREFPVHPTAEKWFAVCPCLRHVPLVGYLIAAFGPAFTLSVGFTFMLSKGIGSRVISASMLPVIMQGYGIDAAQYQRISSMYAMGWSMKPFMALVTDCIALFGYSKRWYLALCASAGSIFTLSYALLPLKPSSANPAAAFIFLAFFCKASIDILAEGHYSRFMRAVPSAGSSLVSWTWGMVYVGTIVGSSMIGPLADAQLTYVAIIIAAAAQLFTVFFFTFNLYGEKKNRTLRQADAFLQYQLQLEKSSTEGHNIDSDAKESASNVQSIEPGDTDKHTSNVAMSSPVAVKCGDAASRGQPRESHEAARYIEPRILQCMCGVFEFNADIIRKNVRLIVFCAVMTCCIVSLALLTMMGKAKYRLYACIGVGVVLCSGAFVVFPRVIAKAALLMFFDSVLYVQIGGALSGFYLAKESCVPGGPHFSNTFYFTVAALINSVFGLVGATLFSTFFSKRKYIYVFVVTTLLRIFGSIFDLIIVKRWNKIAGIPDTVMYILGDSIIAEVCSVMAIMPAQVLMSRLCTRGCESMSFSLLAGISNIGVSVSVVLGSVLMDLLWPVSVKGKCNVENIPILLVVTHMCIPLLILPLSYFLLPDAAMNAILDKNGKPIESIKVQKLEEMNV